MENKPRCPSLHAVVNIQRALQAFLFAEEHTVCLHAGIVLDNGFQIFVKGCLQFCTGEAGAAYAQHASN